MSDAVRRIGANDAVRRSVVRGAVRRSGANDAGRLRAVDEVHRPIAVVALTEAAMRSLRASAAARRDDALTT